MWRCQRKLKPTGSIIRGQVIVGCGLLAGNRQGAGCQENVAGGVRMTDGLSRSVKELEGGGEEDGGGGEDGTGYCKVTGGYLSV